jgi:tRNA (guanine-N7-)-methyltransferase
LRAAGRGLVETLLPGLAIGLPEAGQPLDPFTLFPVRPRAVWLEVGFGGGEHLAWQAAHHSDVGLIGSEVFLNGIASLLGHIRQGGLTNVRVFAEDARRLFPALPDACLERAFILFPDPWPKKRHAERRFVCPDNLDQLARLLVPGGELRIATDDAVYQDWARSTMAARPDFADITGDASVKPPDWPETRYEAKARRDGRTPIFLRYRRRGSDDGG